MTEDFQPIPLNQLYVSVENVRISFTPEGITEMAASLKEHGLFHPIIVRPAGADAPKGKKYAIFDGSRRYYAYLKRVELGEISANFPVSCKIDTSKIDGKELSLAANILREAMTPIEEFKAFLALSEKSISDAEIAARFGCEVTHVRKLLKLARCSHYALGLYDEGNLDIEILHVLTLTDDHARQDQLLKEAPDWWTAQHYKKALTEGKLPFTDKVVKYATVDAYRAAEGPVDDYLFETFGNGGYVTNVPLVRDIALQKLKDSPEVKAAEQEGFKWMVVVLDDAEYDTNGFSRALPSQEPLTKAQQKKHDALAEKLQKLEAKWVATNEKPKGIDELQAQYDAVEERDGIFTDDEKAMSGIIVSLASDCTVDIDRGLVRPEDMPEQKAKGKSKKAATAKATDTEAKEESGLSVALIESLTAEKSAATAAELLQDIDTALQEVVHAKLLDAFSVHGVSSCLKISCAAQSLSRVEGSKAEKYIDDVRKSWSKKFPKDPTKLRAWVQKQDRKNLLQLLAICAGLSVNGVQGKADAGSTRLDHAEALAKDLKLDMVKYFTPTADNYFAKVSRAQILVNIAEAKGQPYAPALEKLKKGDLAKEAEKLVQGTGWLPKPLRVDA